MGPKKKVDKTGGGNDVVIEASACILQRVPPQTFGEQVLRLLNIKDLCQMDSAICESLLREHWWTGGKISKKNDLPKTENCLRHAVNTQQATIEVRSKPQILRLQKRGLVSSHYKVIAKDIGPAGFKLLLDVNEASEVQIQSLSIHNLNTGAKIVPYLKYISQCQHLHTLEVHCAAKGLSGSHSCGKIIANNPQLAKMKLGGGVVNDFAQCLQHAPSLKHLYVCDSNVNIGYCSDVKPLKRQLESVAMMPCHMDGDGLFYALFNREGPNPMLRHVLITRTAKICGIIDDARVSKIAVSCPLLETLSIAGVPGQASAGVVTDAAIVFLAEHCPHLQKLSICDHRAITPVAIDALLTHCHGITDINVYGTAVGEEYLRSRSITLAAEGRVVRFAHAQREYAIE